MFYGCAHTTFGHHFDAVRVRYLYLICVRTLGIVKEAEDEYRWSIPFVKDITLE
jgi:hypothetical protein